MLKDFLAQYDIQEGDLLQCENGEVYELYPDKDCQRIIGPKPHLTWRFIDGVASPPKRILRPRWDPIIFYHANRGGLIFDILQPKQPAQEKPTITICVAKGVKVEVREVE